MNTVQILRSLLAGSITMIGLSAQGQLAWPSNWSTNDGLNPGAGIWKPLLGTNGGLYSDLLDDVTPDNVDIVGGFTDHHTNGPYPAAFYYIDATNIMFRMRVNDSPLQVTGGGATTNFDSYVWGVYLNTDSDIDADFVLQIDESGDHQLEMGTVNPGGGPTNTWDLDIPAITHVGVQDLSWTNSVRYFGVYNATAIDGSHFHTTPATADYFIDLAVPWTFFTNETGLSYLSPFEIALASSTTHISYRGINDLKDSPDGYWSASVAIPEPSAGVFAIPAIGALLFLIRRRRANH